MTSFLPACTASQHPPCVHSCASFRSVGGETFFLGSFSPIALTPPSPTKKRIRGATCIPHGMPSTCSLPSALAQWVPPPTHDSAQCAVCPVLHLIGGSACSPRWHTLLRTLQLHRSSLQLPECDCRQCDGAQRWWSRRVHLRQLPIF